MFSWITAVFRRFVNFQPFIGCSWSWLCTLLWKKLDSIILIGKNQFKFFELGGNLQTISQVVAPQGTLQTYT